MTERRRHERQLAVLGRILRHNLRNALTVIKGQTELLGTDAAASTDEVKAKITDRADSLLELADKEREIVALLRGRTDHVAWDLCALAGAVRDETARQYPEATIELSCSESVPVSVCAGFERAIRELVENAILHSQSEAPVVELTVETDDGTASIEVRDQGPGIPEVERQLLRGQVDESPLYHSAGIGLFLVRQLVHFSDGTLRFHENEPQGSIVRIRLPTA